MGVAVKLDAGLIKAQFFDLYFRSRDLQQLVASASELMQNPIVVYDTGYRVLAASDSTQIDDPYWRDYVRQGYCNYEYIAHILHDERIQKIRSDQGAYRVCCSHVQNRKTVCGVWVNGQSVATVMMIEDRRASTMDDLELIEALAMMIGDTLKKGRARVSTVRSEDVLYGLLDKQLGCEDELQTQLRLAGTTLPRRMKLMVLDISQYQSRAAGGGKTLKEIIQQWLGLCFTVIYRERLVLLYSADQEGGAEALEEKLAGFCREYGLYAGVGEVYQEPFYTHDYYNKTLTILRLGKRAYEDKRVFFAHHTAFFSMLPDLAGEQAWQEYAHPFLKRLRDHDVIHNTELYRTLYIYLLSGCNVQLSAQRLYLHRNSLRNRITKAIELGKIDLDNPIEINDILLSYRILKYYACDEVQAAGGEASALKVI